MQARSCRESPLFHRARDFRVPKRPLPLWQACRCGRGPQSRTVRAHLPQVAHARTANPCLMSPSFVSLELRMTLINITAICPRSLDLLSYMTVFLPRGWFMTVMVNPAEQYHGFGILSPGSRYVLLNQVDPPVVPVSSCLD